MGGEVGCWPYALALPVVVFSPPPMLTTSGRSESQHISLIFFHQLFGVLRDV